MTSESHVHPVIKKELFREKVVAALRQSGQLQKELAQVLGINPQVLSRKLHGGKKTYLSHTEVKQIIKVLVEWGAITTQEEVIELLELMGLNAESFTSLEWKSQPLDRLRTTSHPVERHTLLEQPMPSLQASPAIHFSLPAPSASLLGREAHVQYVLDRLRQPAVRLLTILGVGGIGKTRLALEVAYATQQDFSDGVCFVPLAAIQDISLVPTTVAQALHLAVTAPGSATNHQDSDFTLEALIDYLRGKNFLLILDNVEQIPEIAGFIKELLRSVELLKIMVTSRGVLHLYGEHEFELAPLEICEPDQVSDLVTLAQFSAIRLFIERARAIHPAFRITEENAATIANICMCLDGLPLAIELAAARTKMYPVSLILQRLIAGTGQRLTFLRARGKDVSERHRTLYDTLNWSYGLLDAERQRIFRRLGIFRGGWSVLAAQAVGIVGEPGEIEYDDVLEQMEILMDHSLLKQTAVKDDFADPEQELSFYFLETVREYAMERLQASGEYEMMQRRHAIFYLEWAESMEPVLRSPEQALILAWFTQELGNLHAALTWAFEYQQLEIAQRLAGCLCKFWESCAQFREAHRWVDPALMLPWKAPIIRAKLLMSAARLALWEASSEHSRELAREALELYQANGDRSGATWALFQIGDSWYMEGDVQQAMQRITEVLPLFRTQEIWPGYSIALSRLGAVATLAGEFEQARIWLSEAIPLLRKYGEPVLLSLTLTYRGVLDLIQADYGPCATYLREAFLLARRTNNHFMLAVDLIPLGCLFGIVRDPSYGAKLCSAAEVIFERLATALPTAYKPLYTFYLGSLKARVDEAAWQGWWDEGARLSLEQVYELIEDQEFKN